MSSPAVADGGVLPVVHCAFGSDQSPPLTIAGVPAGAAGLVVICDDPDAVPVAGETWAHWLLVDLPPGTTALAAGADTAPPAGTRRGRTSGGETGWEGPWPPPGAQHSYRLRVYAVSANPLAIAVDRTWTRAQFEAAYAGSILASGGISFRVTGPAN